MKRSWRKYLFSVLCLIIAAVSYYHTALAMSYSSGTTSGTTASGANVIKRSSMRAIADVIKRSYMNDQFIIYGDIKMFTAAGVATEIHLNWIISKITINKLEGGYHFNKLDDNEFSCEFFSELTVVGGTSDVVCDLENAISGDCDYFKCSIGNSLKDENITITATWYPSVEIEESSRPSDDITLDCSDFNNCEDDDTADTDSDGIPDADDNCPSVANPDQADNDHDDVGDVCDNCPNNYNAQQTDIDGDGIGNSCDGSLAGEGPPQVPAGNVFPGTDTGNPGVHGGGSCSLTAGAGTNFLAYATGLFMVILMWFRRYL